LGIDSFIEVTSGSALLWRMSVDADEAPPRTQRTASLADCRRVFLVPRRYITYESAADLWSKRAPEHSIPGILLPAFPLS